MVEAAFKVRRYSQCCNLVISCNQEELSTRMLIENF